VHVSDLDFAASVQVLTLGQILRFDVDTSVTERMRLESLAAMSLTYRFIEGTNIPQDLRYYESKEYKACFLYEHIFGCSTKQCCNLVLLLTYVVQWSVTALCLCTSHTTEQGTWTAICAMCFLTFFQDALK
jgi:hypothetical protein